MKVVHAIGSVAPEYGGPSRAVLDMADAVRARGHKVVVVTTDRASTGPRPPTDYLEADRLEHVVWTRTHAPRAWGASIGLLAALRDQLIDADVVHVHSLYLFHTLAASRLAARSDIPYLVRPHGSLTRYHRSRGRGRKALYHRLVEDRTLQRAALVHCTSEQEAGQLRSAGFAGRIEVVPLGVSVPPAPATIPEGRSELVYIGRLTEKKRPWLAVEAAAELVARGHEVLLHLAGPEDGIAADDLIEHARRLGVGPNVRYHGLLDRQQVETLLHASSVFLLPSREENFGLAAVEALAFGCGLVITTGVALAPDVLAYGAGVVVEATATALADGVEEVMNDSGFATRAHRLASERYSWSSVAADLERLYEELAARR